MVSVSLEFKGGGIQIFFLQENLDHIFRVGRQGEEEGRREEDRESEKEKERKRELENHTRLFVFEWILRGWHTNQQGVGPGMLLTVTHQL